MDNNKEKNRLEDISKSGIRVNIKGIEYKLGVLTIRDLADFRQHIKSKKIELVQNTIANPGERIELISKILDSAVDETREMGTMEGVCFLLWKALQKEQKEITLAEVDMMIDLENIGEVSTILTKLGGKVDTPFPEIKKKKQ